MAPTLTIGDVATRLGVNRDAISHWIANKELAAINVTRQHNAKRPSWRITEEDLAMFELKRKRGVSAPQSRSRKPDKHVPQRTWID